MQPLTTAKQMQLYDRTAIERFGIPGLVLMENAGRAFVDEVNSRVDDLASKRVLVVCGKGNNGGDGYVIARHLLNRGARVQVVLLAPAKEVKGDARINLDALRKTAGASRGLLAVNECTTLRALRALPPADIVVDAIFGTGFSGSVSGFYKEAIDWINAQRSVVASVDIPSGVNADTGVVENVAVNAAFTVTMGLGKIGQYVGDGRERSGIVTVADIGIPRPLLRPQRNAVYRVLAGDVSAVLPHRPLRAHKYSVGKVYIVGGSRNFTGAPTMCALSAMRGGAGAVVLGAPRSLLPVLGRKLTEVILDPLDETDDGTVARAALDRIRDKSRWADVVAIGPGLSRNEETDGVVRQLLEELSVPVVLDADGLTAAAGNPQSLRRRKADTILTPHTGELARMTGGSAAVIELERVESARAAARRFGCIVVLKGAPTVTSSSSGVSFLNSTGNPGMATIGSGDVLTGLIASLRAQGMESVEAAYAGVYLHGRAGDLAAQGLGEAGLLAMDLVDKIPPSIQSVSG